MDTFINASFEALLSGSDNVFNTWVTTQQNKYYEGSSSFNIDDMFIGAKSQYTNLVATGQWRKQDNILAALATRIQNLETNKSHGQSQLQNQNGQSTPSDFIPGTTIEKWRSVKSTDSLTRDNKLYHWCKHHVNPGKYNGLYVTSHDEGHHDEWAAQKQSRGSNRTRAPSMTTPSNTSGAQFPASNQSNSSAQSKAHNQSAQSMDHNQTDKKLSLSDNMKSVLLTRAGMTEAEIDMLMGN